MTQSFRTLLCATTILAGLALAPAAQAGPNGPSPNISPSMGGMSSMRMDFNMRAPNALRDRDTTGVRNGALSCATGEHCPRPSRRNRNNNAGNSGKTKVPAVVRAAPLRAAPPPAPIVDIRAVEAEPPVAPLVDIPAVEAEPPVAPIDGILGVQNPVPASGGADKEETSDARRTTPGQIGGSAAGINPNAAPSLGGGDTPSPTGELLPINPDLAAANSVHIQQFKELEALLNGPLSMLPEILRGGRDGGFKGPVLGQGGRGGSETINSPTAGLGGRSGYAKDGGSSSEWVEYTRETTRHGGASGRRYTTTETFYVGEGRTWRRTETTDSRGGGSRITDEVEYQDENGDSHTWVVDTASDGRGNSSTTYSHDGVAVMADGTPEYKDPGPQPTATFVGEEVESEPQKEKDNLVSMPAEGYGRYTGPVWCGFGGCSSSDLTSTINTPGPGGNPGDAERERPTPVAEGSNSPGPGAATDPCPDCDPSHYGGRGGRGGGTSRPGPSDLGWGADGWIGSGPGHRGGGSGAGSGGGGTGGNPG